MTREEIFKKNFPQYVTEKGVCLSPFWDLFDAGIEAATSELNKGIIQVLTKENAELKDKCNILDKSLVTSTKNNIERQKIIDELKEEMSAKQVVLNDFKSRVEIVTGRYNQKSSQLTKAKEIIEELSKSLFLAKGIIRDLIDDTVDFKESKERAIYCYKQEKFDTYKEAVQFLKESAE